MKGRAEQCRLRSKKILITAGPTWVAIDRIRVVTSTSSGTMGLTLAQKAASLGMKVDLLLGPVGQAKAPAGVRVFRFCYFEELRDLVRRRLKAVAYDVIVHAAAVSDYLIRPLKGKIPSGKKQLILRFKKAPKIIDSLRSLRPRAVLVMFKLEADVTERRLLACGRRAGRNARADFVVANQVVNGRYRGYVLNAGSSSPVCFSKQKAAGTLFEALKARF